MRLQPHEQAERTGGHLREDLRPFVQSPKRLFHHVSPQVWLGLDFQEGESNRAADFCRKPPHPAHLFGGSDQVQPCGTCWSKLKHAASACRKPPPETEKLVFGGESAGHGFAVYGSVADGAAG